MLRDQLPGLKLEGMASHAGSGIRAGIMALILGLPLHAQTRDSPIGTQIQVPVEQQDWQKRRAQSLKVIMAARSGDPGASQAMDALLTACETHPVSVTPIENLDLIGLFYMPKDGVEKCLAVVAFNCQLGWYDALRFGTESGRAEITANEGFFARAYTLGGDSVRRAAAKFINENPDKVRALVEQGLVLAEKYRKADSYDREWPTAYGLEGIIAAEGGRSERKLLPESAWDRAWEDAKVRVRTFYGLSESGGSGVSKYFTDPKEASLVDAVDAGDTARIDKMVSEGADINTPGRGGVTPLFWALVKGNKKTFEGLLSHGANPNIRITEAFGAIGPGNSVTSVAAMHEDIWFLQEVLNHGGDPNLENPTRSQTPILASLSSLRTENAKLLVSAGANGNWQDRSGQTPLMFAATLNQYEVVFQMLNAGADPTIKNKWGNTVAWEMKKIRIDPNSVQFQWKQRVIELLSAKGFDLNVPDPTPRPFKPAGAQ